MNQERQSEVRQTKLRKFLGPKVIPTLPIARSLLSFFLLVVNHYSAHYRFYLSCAMALYEDKIMSVL